MRIVSNEFNRNLNMWNCYLSRCRKTHLVMKSIQNFPTDYLLSFSVYSWVLEDQILSWYQSIRSDYFELVPGIQPFIFRSSSWSLPKPSTRFWIEEVSFNMIKKITEYESHGEQRRRINSNKRRSWSEDHPRFESSSLSSSIWYSWIVFGINPINRFKQLLSVKQRNTRCFPCQEQARIH